MVLRCSKQLPTSIWPTAFPGTTHEELSFSVLFCLVTTPPSVLSAQCCSLLACPEQHKTLSCIPPSNVMPPSRSVVHSYKSLSRSHGPHFCTCSQPSSVFGPCPVKLVFCVCTLAARNPENPFTLGQQFIFCWFNAAILQGMPLGSFLVTSFNKQGRSAAQLCAAQSQLVAILFWGSNLRICKRVSA